MDLPREEGRSLVNLNNWLGVHKMGIGILVLFS